VPALASVRRRLHTLSPAGRGRLAPGASGVRGVGAGRLSRSPLTRSAAADSTSPRRGEVGIMVGRRCLRWRWRLHTLSPAGRGRLAPGASGVRGSVRDDGRRAPSPGRLPPTRPLPAGERWGIVVGRRWSRWRRRVGACTPSPRWGEVVGRRWSRWRSRVGGCTPSPRGKSVSRRGIRGRRGLRRGS
jgi:hypothetical protein